MTAITDRTRHRGDTMINVSIRGADETLGFYTKGNTDLLYGMMVAIVGSRSSTSYGGHIAFEMAGDLARAGCVVVSGGAYGIDISAHRGAWLGRGARTIVVLPCGIDRPYPAAHKGLFDRVVDAGGLIVSSYPPDTLPTRERFLERNRVIAALSHGVVVVEGTIRSGTASTARHAQALGRPVMAVPGPVTSAHSELPHDLIRQGKAALVTGWDDVLRTLDRKGVAGQ